MVYAEKPRLNYKGGGETSLRALMSAAAHASAAALEKTVNVLESATGLDIDGDGDVGVAGHKNASSTPRPAKEAHDASAPAAGEADRSSKVRGVSSKLLSPLASLGSGKYESAVSGASAAEETSLVSTPRGSHAEMSSGGRLGRMSYLPPVKLLDFGVSQVCVEAVDGELQSAEKKRFDDSILKATGTPLFFSPEMCHLPPIPFHGRPADVWAAGVSLCMLVSGELPFTGDNMPEIWRKVQEEPPELDTVLPKHCSPLLRDILGAMLAKDPNQRPTAKQLRAHPWVTREGTEPLPEQPYLPLEITDDDIKQAVKQFGDTFSVLKAGQKWKKFTAKRRESESEPSTADENEPPKEAAEAGEATTASNTGDSEEMPKRKPSMVERQLTAKLDVGADRI